MSAAATARSLTAELTALCHRLPGMRVVVETDATGWAVLVTHDGGGLVRWGVRSPDAAGLRTALLSEGLDSLRTDLDAHRTARPLPARTAAPVVMTPLMAAIAVHECVGHTSEADNHAAYGHRLGIGLGDRWTRVPLTVTDDPTRSGHCGSYDHDDEGVAAVPVRLVEDGRWSGLLTSRSHPGPAGSNGHGRRAPAAPGALPRMGVLSVGPGEHRAEDLVASVADGFLLGAPREGGSVREYALLKPAWARRIRDGRITDEVYRDLVLRAHKVQLMRRLRGVGDRVVMNDPYHRCEKKGQEVSVSLEAPYLLFDDLLLYPDGGTP
ncbi:metallopeptidase TldD-related protein [Streptomyces sp. NPDC001744]|uniref:metallopeptidase TldD-related protein n=1 Tax=Streptomyces sp. NPDC001744 TaxID=3364606 RepID=UPI0036C7F85F